MAGLEIPQGPDQLTPGWLTDALRADGCLGPDGAVTSFDTEPVGQGSGFIGLLMRLHPRYTGDSDDAPATIIAKFPSPTPEVRAMGKAYGAYEREVRFYSELAGDIGVYTPRCYYKGMDIDADRYFLLLEDLAATGRIGDQVTGCSLEEALLAVGELARFHARWWDSPKLDGIDWLPLGTDLVRVMPALYPQAKPVFMELYGARLTGEIARAMDNLPDRVLAMLPELEARPQTILHGDHRLDNLFFGAEGGPYRLAVIDWQFPNRGFGAYDLAFFVSGSLPPEQREGQERELIERYHDILLESGVGEFPLASLLDDYRRALLVVLALESVSAATLERTNERAVQLWSVMVERLIAAIADTNALELVPRPGSVRL